VKELAKNIGTLYNSGIVAFMNHMKNTSIKFTNKQRNAKLGQLPSTTQGLKDNINKKIAEAIKK
jgi:hypothetical protein